MRPDLFQVVVAGVPFVDVINTMCDPSIPLTTGPNLSLLSLSLSLGLLCPDNRDNRDNRDNLDNPQENGRNGATLMKPSTIITC